FAPDDEMIETLAPDRSDQPFSEAILPRRSRCDGLVPYAHGTQTAGDDGAVDAIPIANNVVRGLGPRERLGGLAGDPFGGRIGRHVDPDEVSPVQPDDDEGIEQVEAKCRDNEQVNGGDVRRVVAQKGAPSLTWRSLPLDHVFGHRRLGDLKAELKQFAVDAWCAPQWVLDTHLPDQCAQLRVNLRPPAKRARLPTPVPTKAGPMPTDERLGTDDRDDLQDRRKPSIQLDKEQAIAVRKRTHRSTIRRNTTTWCRSAAFSASSRLFDLNGEIKTLRTKHSSAIIVRRR